MGLREVGRMGGGGGGGTFCEGGTKSASRMCHPGQSSLTKSAMTTGPKALANGKINS